MRIQKYGYGGVYTAGPTAGSAATPTTSSSKGTSKNDTPLKDSILGLLKESALPNDHRGTLELAMQVLSNYDMAPGLDISSAEYVALLNAINDGKTNQDVWKKASDYIYRNDTAEEAALDSYGNMFVGKLGENNKMEFKKVRPEEYATAVSEGWQALSNAGLLTERANNDDLRWDMSLISGVNSSTNASKVSKKVLDAINALPETQEGYILNKQGKLQTILHGAQYAMAEGSGSEYSYGSKTDAPQDVNEFYNYAWNYILNDNDRSFLKAAIAQRGGDPTDAVQCLNIVTSGTSLYTHRDFSIKEENPSGSGRRGSGGGSDGTLMAGTLDETYTTGLDAGLTEQLTIAPSGSGVSFKILGQNVGPITDADQKKRLGRVSVQYALENAYGIGRDMTNTHSVTFGDEIISADQLTGIMYDDSNMYRVKLPAVKTADGHIKPDFELLEKAEQLKAMIGNQNVSKDMIDRYVDSMCPGARYNERTEEIEFPPERTQLFLTFQGIAGTRYVDFNKDSRFVTMDGSNGRDHIDIYDNTLKYGKANPGKNDDKRSDAPASHWSTRDRLYKGNVFIPIDITAGSRNHNPGLFPKSTHTNIPGRVAEMERERAVDYYGEERSYSWDD